MQFEYTFERARRIATAWRADASWSHGLRVEIRDEAGSLLNNILFASHPDQPDFDDLQAKSTEELIDMVVGRLSSVVLEETLQQARQQGIGTLVLNFF